MVLGNQIYYQTNRTRLRHECSASANSFCRNHHANMHSQRRSVFEACVRSALDQSRLTFR